MTPAVRPTVTEVAAALETAFDVLDARIQGTDDGYVSVSASWSTPSGRLRTMTLSSAAPDDDDEDEDPGDAGGTTTVVTADQVTQHRIGLAPRVAQPSAKDDRGEFLDPRGVPDAHAAQRPDGLAVLLDGVAVLLAGLADTAGGQSDTRGGLPDTRGGLPDLGHDTSEPDEVVDEGALDGDQFGDLGSEVGRAADSAVVAAQIALDAASHATPLGLVLVRHPDAGDTVRRCALAIMDLDSALGGDDFTLGRVAEDSRVADAFRRVIGAGVDVAASLCGDCLAELLVPGTQLPHGVGESADPVDGRGDGSNDGTDILDVADKVVGTVHRDPLRKGQVAVGPVPDGGGDSVASVSPGGPTVSGDGDIPGGDSSARDVAGDEGICGEACT